MSADAARAATPAISLRRTDVRIAWTPLSDGFVALVAMGRGRFFPPAIAHETHDAVKTGRCGERRIRPEGDCGSRRCSVPAISRYCSAKSLRLSPGAQTLGKRIGGRRSNDMLLS